MKGWEDYRYLTTTDQGKGHQKEKQMGDETSKSR